VGQQVPAWGNKRILLVGTRIVPEKRAGLLSWAGNEGKGGTDDELSFLLRKPIGDRTRSFIRGVEGEAKKIKRRDRLKQIGRERVAGWRSGVERTGEF